MQYSDLQQFCFIWKPYFFKDEKEILRIFSTSCWPFGNILAKDMFTKIYRVIVILVNTDLVKSKIYYWMWMKFYPYFTHLFFDFGEIRYKKAQKRS